MRMLHEARNHAQSQGVSCMGACSESARLAAGQSTASWRILPGTPTVDTVTFLSKGNMQELLKPRHRCLRSKTEEHKHSTVQAQRNVNHEAPSSVEAIVISDWRLYTMPGKIMNVHEHRPKSPEYRPEQAEWLQGQTKCTAADGQCLACQTR